MMNVINVITLNCRGLRDPAKRSLAFKFLRSYDISFLQETHHGPSDTWSRLWSSTSVRSIFTSTSTQAVGVGIVLSNKFADIVSLWSCVDPNGRYIIWRLNATLYGRKLHLLLLSVYAPNDGPGRRRLFSSLVQHPNLADLALDDLTVIMGGDFNCISDPNIDRIATVSADSLSGTIGSDELAALCSHLSIMDAYRHYFPLERRHTWMSPGASVATRIDKIFVSDDLLPISSPSFCSAPFSDHLGPTVSIRWDAVDRGKSYWKLNCKYLRYNSFQDDITKTIREWEATKHEFSSPLVAWDYLKLRLRSTAQQFAKAVAFVSDRRHLALVKRVERTRKSWTDLPSEETSTDYALATESLAAHLTSRLEGAILRSRQRWLHQGERPTAYFLRLEKARNLDNTVQSIRVDGHSVTDTPSMLTAASSYYSQLYRPEGPVDILALKTLLDVAPRLDADDALLLEQDITLSELSGALARTPTGRAPGLDGLPAEFWQTFWPLLGKHFVKLINWCLRNNEPLPTSCSTSAICLLYKGKGSRDDLGSWRPLSLMSCDTKIMCKALAIRLERIAPRIVHGNQAGFVKGRHIHDHILSLQYSIDYCDQIGHPGAILLLDQQKAFDRVHWSYRDHLLEAMGFGLRFRSYIHLLYRNANAMVQINGHLSPRFPILRGTRQGCPLSPVLFALLDEPFACLLRSSPLRGLPTPTTPLRLLQFADDKAIGLYAPSDLPHLLSCLDIYSRGSGARINDSKSELLLLGPQDQPSALRWSAFPASVILPGTSTRYLGVQIGSRRSLQAVWAGPLEKIRKTLQAWQSRDLSLRGKCVILRSLAVSQLIYPGSCAEMPADAAKSLDNLMRSFLWSNKRPLVNLEHASAPWRFGGLSFPRASIIIKIAHVRLFKRFISMASAPEDSVPIWALLLRHHLSALPFSKVFGISPERFLLSDVKFGGYNVLPARLSFWSNIVSQLDGLNIRVLPPYSRPEILTEPLFYNPLLRDPEGFTLGDPALLPFARAGYTHICDIWDLDRNRFVDFASPQLRLIFNTRILPRLPLSWRLQLTTDDAESIRQARPLIQRVVLDTRSAHQPKHIVRTSLEKASPNSLVRSLLPSLPSYDSKLWLWIHHPKRPHKHADLLWKIVHQRLPVGALTRHYSHHEFCPACPTHIETSTHLFVDCPVARQCWAAAGTLWPSLRNGMGHFAPPSHPDRIYNSAILGLEIPKNAAVQLRWLLLTSTLLYEIWLSRCRHIFDPGGPAHSHAAIWAHVRSALQSLFKSYHLPLLLPTEL